jgi:hypothetical protein
MRDLTEGMNSRIGPSTPDGINACSRHLFDGIGQFALNTGAIGLDLPALEIGPVISNQ